MPKHATRHLTVLDTFHITPNMKRIVLGGPALEGFPPEQESAYIKLQIPDAANDSVVTRTYTVRNHREEANELDVDFVLHGDDSPASAWASHAQIGDVITISGPGGKKLLDFSADWFLLAGDMTALPAIGVNIEQLPANATGYAVIEIPHKNDMQSFNVPESFQVRWVINQTPFEENSCLVEEVRKLKWLEGKPSVWAACEFSSMRELRKYFRHEKDIDKKAVYVSSYWKRGLSEEQHKKVKRTDSENTEIR